MPEAPLTRATRRRAATHRAGAPAAGAVTTTAPHEAAPVPVVTAAVDPSAAAPGAPLTVTSRGASAPAGATPDAAPATAPVSVPAADRGRRSRRRGTTAPVPVIPAAPRPIDGAHAAAPTSPSADTVDVTDTADVTDNVTIGTVGVTDTRAIPLSEATTSAHTMAPAASVTASLPAAGGTTSAASDAPTMSAAPTAPTAPTTSDADTGDVDAFEAAARLFAFTPASTAPTPVLRSDESSASDHVGRSTARDRTRRGGRRARPQTAPSANTPAPRSRKRGLVARLAAASLSVTTLAGVALLALSTTLPADAIAAPGSADGSAQQQQLAGDLGQEKIPADEIQAYVSPADAVSSTAKLDRSSNYSTASLVDMAGTIGIQHVSSAVFTNNRQCAVQWPFAVGVPMSYGFGQRPGEFHLGDDFTPGMGAHIQAIADGTVRIASESYFGYGVAIIIDHIIDGQHVASLYGHMQYGSLQVHAGEKVRVGQYIGRTGSTGFSTGAHTHFEIRAGGTTPIDPIPWMRAHNRC